MHPKLSRIRSADMKQLMVRFIVALFTFVIGTSLAVLSTGFSYSSQLTSKATAASRLAEENVITGIVLYHLARTDSMVEKSNYYVSCYNYSDPPTEVMTYLTGTGVHAEPLSQIQYDSASYYLDPVFLRVGRIRWLNDEEILVGGSLRGVRWNRDARAYLFHLVRDHGSWRITSAETIT
jgi:hypothetical protein